MDAFNFMAAKEALAQGLASCPADCAKEKTALLQCSYVLALSQASQAQEEEA